MPPLAVALGVLLLVSSATPLIPKSDEDADLSVVALITKYGYPAEKHYVTTSDGYILGLHRIPHGKNSDTVSKKVVVLEHGLYCSSADFIITGPDHALGYILADAGFDVWMGNARGNRESRNHTKLNPNTDPEFWQFSWHEIGVFDIPATIDYILAQTGQSSLYYIGHSQGATAFYVMASVHPEYNAKVKAHFSLSPLAYVKHMFSPPMRVLALLTLPLQIVTKILGINELFRRKTGDWITLAGRLLCSDGTVTQGICTNAIFLLCGFSPKEMNATVLPAITGHTPAGGATRQLLHYTQEINSGYFRQYDFGLGNLKKYKSLKPPSYNISQITTPIYLFYSNNDWIASATDARRFCDELGSVCADMILVEDHAFNHLDFTYGIYAREVVYNKLISLMSD